RLSLVSGDTVALKNDFGTYHGKVMVAPMATGTLEIHWPEGNVLVDSKARSPLATIPAYKEIFATLERINETEKQPSVVRT
ncbi:MAG TPA: hypothetical protein VKD91_03845, partial [Pyrinomonadaceae bacterium]|nr:hypothetical protein [Pyrinomonadaceae bacterium]